MYNVTVQFDPAPVVSLGSPGDGFLTMDGTVNFLCNATDNKGVLNITLYTNITGDWEANTTQSGDFLNVTLTNIPDGIFVWNCMAIDTDGQSSWGTNLTFYAWLDSDGDGIPDKDDNLEGNESDVNTTGVSDLNITVGGNGTNGSFSGVQEVRIYDGTFLLMNFTHNFSISQIDLNLVSIYRTSDSLLIDLSDQLLSDEFANMYLLDNSFTEVCHKNSTITSPSGISASCTAADETIFTSCLANATGVAINGITCLQDDTAITFSKLKKFSIRGTSPQSSSGGGGGQPGGTNFRRASGSITVNPINSYDAADRMNSFAHSFDPETSDEVTEIGADVSWSSSTEQEESSGNLLTGNVLGALKTGSSIIIAVLIMLGVLTGFVYTHRKFKNKPKKPFDPFAPNSFGGKVKAIFKK